MMPTLVSDTRMPRNVAVGVNSSMTVVVRAATLRIGFGAVDPSAAASVDASRGARASYVARARTT